MSKVLVTPEAEHSVHMIKSLLNGPLLNQINLLKTEGINLANPSNWDGHVAMNFRSDWPAHHQALEDCIVSLYELKQNIQRITENIRSAGGGY